MIELKEWRRHILLEKPVITVILDEIKARPGSKIQVRFHPGVNYKIIDNFTLLEGNEGKMAMIPITSDDFCITSGKHAFQAINATAKFQWIDYFETVIKSTQERTTIATIFVPVENAEEAKIIANSKRLTADDSGNLSISFTHKGKIYNYEYQNTRKGLLLKK